MVVGASSALELLSWRNSGQVDDGLLAVCSALVGVVVGLEDRDGDSSDSCRRRVLLHVCRELLSQAKVDIAQLVGPGVSGPHVYKYLPNGTKVLFHRPLLDRDPAV